MDCLRASQLARAQDRVTVEVAERGRGRADTNGLVRGLDVERVGVRVRVDGNRLDSELFAGAHDANGNLAAVGNQDLVKQFLEAGRGASENIKENKCDSRETGSHRAQCERGW